MKMERWRRPPYASLSDADMERVKAFFYGHRRQVIIVQRLKIESIAAYFVIRTLIVTVGTRQPKDLVIINVGYSEPSTRNIPNWNRC